MHFSLKLFISSLTLSFWCNSNVVSTQGLMPVFKTWKLKLFPKADTWEDKHSRAGRSTD